MTRENAGMEGTPWSAAKGSLGLCHGGRCGLDQNIADTVSPVCEHWLHLWCFGQKEEHERTASMFEALAAFAWRADVG
jgi:hypothetical protein